MAVSSGRSTRPCSASRPGVASFWPAIAGGGRDGASPRRCRRPGSGAGARAGKPGPRPRPGAGAPPAMRAFMVSLLTLATVLAQASATAAPPPAPADLEVAAVNGLYPLWENTGLTHGSGTGQVGYLHAQGALGPFQLGTQPLLDVYGTPNLAAKVALW